MDFNEKINHIMKTLGANNAAVAYYAGFDRTNLSRIRSGSRIPLSSGTTAHKLIEGIYLFADDKNELPRLCAIIGCNPDSSADEIRGAIKSWLYDGISEKPGALRKKGGQRSYDTKSFGEKLDAAMTLCDLSNIRLSQLINVDASLISRFRSGVRSPRSNPKMAMNLANTLWDRIKWTGKEAELAKLISPDLKYVDEGILFSWLCDFETIPEDHSLAVEKLIETFDMLSANPTVLPDFPESEFFSGEDVRDTYMGITGLQEAVIRFLSTVAASDAKEILLYSDERMDWMTGDAAFRLKWSTLMSRCIKSKIRIKIIHNIDRGFSEMNDAIISWLPLYMSGMIESFYSSIPNGRRFSHTMFLCPGKACIEAFHVAGSEGEGIYHYYTGESLLDSCHKAYEKLLESSFPLVKTTNPTFRIPPEGELIVIQNTPSVATMTEELADSFGSQSLKKEWRYRRATLESSLKNAYVYECFPVVSMGDVTSGAAAVESLPGTEKLSYTKDQYIRHIQNIVSLLEEESSYRFYPLKETPFSNVKIVTGADFVKITSIIDPEFSLLFTHPLMCSAFKNYADNLRNRCRSDRNTLRKELTKSYL